VCVRSAVCVCKESLSSLPYHIVGVFRRSAVSCGRWVYVVCHIIYAVSSMQCYACIGCVYGVCRIMCALSSMRYHA